MRADQIVELTSAAPDFFADPYPAYRVLRTQAPVRRLRMPGGEAVWMVLGYDAVRAALADPRLRNDIRHSAEFESDGGYAIGRNMLQVDPPDHTRLRALVSRQFTARRIAALRPRIERISARLLDAMARRPVPTDPWNPWELPDPVDPAVPSISSAPTPFRSRSPSSANSSGCRSRTGTRFTTGPAKSSRSTTRRAPPLPPPR